MLYAQIHDHDNSRLATVSPPDAEVARNERTARAPCRRLLCSVPKTPSKTGKQTTYSGRACSLRRSSSSFCLTFIFFPLSLSLSFAFTFTFAFSFLIFVLGLTGVCFGLRVSGFSACCAIRFRSGGFGGCCVGSRGCRRSCLKSNSSQQERSKNKSK